MSLLFLFGGLETVRRKNCWRAGTQKMGRQVQSGERKVQGQTTISYLQSCNQTTAGHAVKVHCCFLFVCLFVCSDLRPVRIPARAGVQVGVDVMPCHASTPSLRASNSSKEGVERRRRKSKEEERRGEGEEGGRRKEERSTQQQHTTNNNKQQQTTGKQAVL